MKKLTCAFVVSAALLSTQAFADTPASDPAVKVFSKITGSNGIQYSPTFQVPLTSLKGDLFLNPHLALSAQFDTFLFFANWVSLGATYFIEPTGNGFFTQAHVGHASLITRESSFYGELGAGYRFPTNEKGDFVDLSGNFQAYATNFSTFGLRIMYGQTL